MILFCLYFVRRCSAGIVGIRHGAHPPILLRAFPRNGRLQDMASAFGCGGELSPNANKASTRSLLCGVKVAVVIRVGRVGKGTALRGRLKGIKDQDVVYPLLPHFRVRNEDNGHANVCGNLQLNVICRARRGTFCFLQFMLPAFVFLRLRLLLYLNRLFVFVVDHAFMGCVHGRIGNGEEVCAMTTAIPRAMRPSGEPF